MNTLSKNISEYLTLVYGEDATRRYSEFITLSHTPFLRLNNQFYSEEKLFTDLNEYGISLQKVEEMPGAFKVISGEDLIGKTLQHILGKYYIQSLSSMIPPLILEPKANDIILDLCAAPGSKTTQIAGLMGNTGVLISNESNSDRVKTLVHNIDKMNLINTGIINNRGEWLCNFYHEYFDKILVDAPCSALGVIQKKGEVSNWWSVDRIEKLTEIQFRLITSAIRMVKIGGEIVYSTCTLTPEENELIINHVVNKYPLEILDINVPIKSAEGLTQYKGIKLNPSLNKVRRILPWEVNSEGFFITKLRKTGKVEPAKNMPVSQSTWRLIDYKDKDINKHLMQLSNKFGIPDSIWEKYKYLIKKNEIFFTSNNWQNKNLSLFNRIGTRLGTFDKNNEVQLHSFAAQYFNTLITNGISILENKNDLKTYINGGIVKIPASTSGQNIIKYKDFILGTAVNVENGLKSQFPKSKRMQEMI